MLTTVLAGLRYRKARLLLSCVAVALGVAFVAGTLLLNASVSASYYGGFAVAAKNVSALVAAPKSGNPPGQPDGQSVPEDLLATVRGTPGVEQAFGRVAGQATLAGPDGNGFGIDADPELGGFTLLTGHLPAAADQVDVDGPTAADQHLRLGQPVRVLQADGTSRSFYLAGTIDLGVNAIFGDDPVMAFQPAVALAVTGQSGYTSIVVRAAPGVSQDALAAAIRARVGPAYQVQTGAQFASAQADAATHVGKVFGDGLLLFAAIALVVACIVIYNTFAILIAQRSREFALLRCVGASRRQVFRAMIAEGFAVGVVASAAGVLGGLALAWALSRIITPHGGSPAPLVLQPLAIFISAATGVAVTTGACVLPARAATRIPPAAAVSEMEADTLTRRTGWARTGFAAVTAAAGLALTAAGTHTGSSGGLLEIAAGGCVFFLAVLAIGPLIVPPLVSLFAWLPARFAAGGGTTVRMAAANARRNPHRVAITTAALTIGLTLMTVFTVVMSSLQATSDAAISGHFPFDYIVAAPGQQSVPPGVTDALRRAPGLSLVAAAYAEATTVDGQQLTIGAYSHEALGLAVKPAMVAGSLAAVGPGTAAVSTGHLGQMITVGTPYAGRLRLRVVAVYDANTYHTPIPAVLISVADLSRGFRPSGAQAVVIDAAPGVSPAASRAAVNAAIASDPLLGARSQANYKAGLNHSVTTVFDLVTALLGLAVLIALTGISNTLTLSVIERTRESAVLRALGFTRGQLRRMLLTEALLMAALAVLLGGALGIGFGAALVDSFRASSGLGLLSVPAGRLALYALVAGAAAVAAAVLPARRAARSSVITNLGATS